jgi:hypothetical protein
MGRAAHAMRLDKPDTGARLHPLTGAMIHDEIQTLLKAPPTGDDAPSLDDLEHTLTAGYARALALEAERWRLERRIAKVAAALSGSAETQHSELATLGKRLSAADGDLTRLRELLSSLRARTDEVRTSRKVLRTFRG